MKKIIKKIKKFFKKIIKKIKELFTRNMSEKEKRKRAKKKEIDSQFTLWGNILRKIYGFDDFKISIA